MKQGTAQQQPTDYTLTLSIADEASQSEISDAVSKTVNERKAALDDAIENDTGGLPALLRGYARRILR